MPTIDALPSDLAELRVGPCTYVREFPADFSHHWLRAGRYATKPPFYLTEVAASEEHSARVIALDRVAIARAILSLGGITGRPRPDMVVLEVETDYAWSGGEQDGRLTPWPILDTSGQGMLISGYRELAEAASLPIEERPECPLVFLVPLAGITKHERHGGRS